MSTANIDYAKTLDMPAEWQAKAAAFADAKGLSLAAREVVAEYREPWQGRDGKMRPGQLVLIVTADALMAIALRDGGRVFAPIQTQWTGDGREWTDVWLDAKPPAACRVTFEVQGIDELVRVVHTWSEYTQGKASATQQKMPASMLAKATRSMGVRQIAPSATSGLLSEEEAHAVDNAATTEAAETRATIAAVTPEVDKVSTGTKLSRAEQFAARKEELVRVGKALRADCGEEAATALARAMKDRGCDPNALLQADLKALLQVAANERAASEALAAAGDPEPVAIEPEAVVEPEPVKVDGAQNLVDSFDGEFVI